MGGTSQLKDRPLGNNRLRFFSLPPEAVFPSVFSPRGLRVRFIGKFYRNLGLSFTSYYSRMISVHCGNWGKLD